MHICVFLSAAKLAIFLQDSGLQPTSHSSESTQVALIPSDHRDRMTLNCWTLFLNYCAIVEKVCLVICSSHRRRFPCWTGSAYHFQHLALREERFIVGMWMECAVLLWCQGLSLWWWWYDDVYMTVGEGASYCWRRSVWTRFPPKSNFSFGDT